MKNGVNSQTEISLKKNRLQSAICNLQSVFGFLLKYYLFWVIFSLLSKVIFLFYQYPETLTLTGMDYWMIFWKGLRMDFSFGGYIMMLAAVIMAIGVFIPIRWVKHIFSGLTLVLLLICCLVVVGDLEVFSNWGYHVDATPLVYLKTPKEAMASTSTLRIAVLLLLYALFVVFLFWFYKKWVISSLKEKRQPWWFAGIYLLIAGAMIIPVRGGFNVAPMNVSFVFFNNRNMYANQAAINPVWNFLYEVTHMKQIKGEYNFMPLEEAQARVEEANRTSGEFPRVLTTTRPNVVVILLETFTANALDAMPNLQAAAREGIYFSNIYATGNRSDRGLLGAISAFPAYPNVSMLKYPNKTHTQPRFPVDFEQQGYNTTFYYAGDLNFGGFRSYVTMSFQKAITEEDFSGEALKHTFKWGIHDEFLFDKLYHDLEETASPFLTMVFTMSSHEPFSVPMETVIPGEDNASKLKNAIYYTDRYMGAFFDRCKASGIWDNTLFVLLADHGTRHIGNLSPSQPEAFKIPLVFTGGVMQVRDSTVTTIGSQTDMVATLFAQLGMDASAFKYSKNLLSPEAKPCAFYAYPHAAAVVVPEGICVFDLQSRAFVGEKSMPEEEQLLKAYLQLVDNDFKDEHQK